jgi:hypothetical protein
MQLEMPVAARVHENDKFMAKIAAQQIVRRLLEHARFVAMKKPGLTHMHSDLNSDFERLSDLASAAK